MKGVLTSWLKPRMEIHSKQDFMILEEHLNLKIHENETLVYEINNLNQQKDDLEKRMNAMQRQYQNDILKLKDDLSYDRKENMFLKQVNVDMQKRVNVYSEENELLKQEIDMANIKLKYMDVDIYHLNACTEQIFSLIDNTSDGTIVEIITHITKSFENRKNKHLLEKSSSSDRFVYFSITPEFSTDIYYTIIQYLDEVKQNLGGSRLNSEIMKTFICSHDSVLNGTETFLEALKELSLFEVNLIV